VTEEATYQSLYRKYRPQGPNEVIGQEHVIRALVGAVREDRLAHAFLFCGPRGTGKTSTARILAKMVNCVNGPTAEPCGVCEQCLRIRDGSHLDVVEIDAASHGGVDDARELRERAPTAPVMGREKVYILDEAQRLSREAFDALLKLFEEPPPSVRFVLATTEPHKMPATIVGRCQRFDFRRIGTEPLADLLERIAGQEGLKLTREAAEQLARQAEGSARDAETLLDQTAVLGGGTITQETVALLVGTGEEDLPFELADAIAVADGAAVFEAVDRLVQEGHDLRHATGQILQHVRDLLVVHSAPEEPRALDASPERHARLASQAAKFSVAELSRILALLVAAQTDMRWTTSPRLTLELALVRSAIPEADPNPAGLAARIERLERLAGIEGVVVGGEAGGAASAGHAPPYPRSGAPDHPVTAPLASDPPATAPHTDEGTDTAEDVVEVPDGEPTVASDVGSVEGDAVALAAPVGAHAPDAGALDVGAIRRSWAQLVTHLQQQRQMILAANLDSVTAAAYDGTTLELAFPPGRRFAVRKVEERGDQLREAFTAVFGIAPRIVCSERGVPAAASEVIEDDDPPPAPDELLERFRSEFGAEVVDAEGE
jgi:DNA polymerase-3 subunit gamma/tau